MFSISYPKQEEVVKDLKIILAFKTSEGPESKSSREFFVNSSNAFLLSPIISTNTQKQDTLSIFKQEITTNNSPTFSKDLFVSLLESLFNNDPIKYTEKNYSTLHEISEIFGIDKLKTSVERYKSYLDRINDFTVGRLSIIDSEFLCQLYLQNLNESNIEDTRNASNRFIDEFGPEFFSYVLFRCIYSNFSNSPLYLAFIVHEIPNNYYIEFVKSLERLFRFGSSARCNCDDSLSVVNCLIRFFLEEKLINYDDREIFAYKCGCQFYTYQFFDYDHEDVHRNSTDYIYRHYDEISKDNFSLHRKLVLNGKNQNPLFQLIEKDDVDSLQNYFAFNPDKTVDSIIEECYYEARPEFQSNSFSLLEIAAYFGSVKIFKYLILNKAGIRNEQLSKMAIYGGNAEIIRICKQKDISFKPVRNKNNLLNVSFLQIAIKMNHLDILRWLIEEEGNDITKDDINIVGYALQVANFEAYYYLVSVLYDIKNHNDGNEEEFKFKFEDILKSLVFSYNLPIMKNYLHLKYYELFKYQKYSIYYYDKYFNDIFLGNYDMDIIELLLENNKLKELETIPQVCMSSFSYQKFARYLITHENVSYDENVIISIRNNLLNPDHSLASNLSFIQEQIQLLFDISSNPIDKLSLLPILFKYNLLEPNFSQQYKDLITKSPIPLKIPTELFDVLIKYVDIDMIKLIYNYADKKSIKKCYSFDTLADAINRNKIDTVLYLLSSSEVPYSSVFKFSDKSFFIFLSNIQKIEDFNKLIQLYTKKRLCFYSGVFLPNVLYNLNEENEEVNNYILNLPEIEPYINKENKKYKNLPPLLYQNESSLFWSNEKFDINIRQSGTNKNLLSFLHDTNKIKQLLSIEKFEYTIDDVMMCIQENGYPYSSNIFEIFLNGLLYGEENKIKIELNFNDDQINQLFGMICINDSRLDMAKQFYSKYSDRIDINYLNPKNNGLVILDAIDNNAIETVKFLINIKDIDLNKRGDSGILAKHGFCYNITPFCFAVYCEAIEILQLFAHKCDRFNVNETYTYKISFNILMKLLVYILLLNMIIYG